MSQEMALDCRNGKGLWTPKPRTSESELRTVRQLRRRGDCGEEQLHHRWQVAAGGKLEVRLSHGPLSWRTPMWTGHYEPSTNLLFVSGGQSGGQVSSQCWLRTARENCELKSEL